MVVCFSSMTATCVFVTGSTTLMVLSPWFTTKRRDPFAGTPAAAAMTATVKSEEIMMRRIAWIWGRKPFIVAGLG
jgi:hypothetical protein